MKPTFNVREQSEIYIGPTADILSGVLPEGRVIVVSDATIDRLYHPLLAPYDTVLIGAGESIKTLQTVESIYRRFIELGADRSTFVLAVGGGIVTDVAGFAAATYMRGLSFGFVSTTLLGQVDASVGGKNGVNVDGYKNMAGTFKQPRFVICDPEMLRTLSDREFRTGLAEVVKAAVIADADLFTRIENVSFEALRADTDLLTDAISAAVRVKADIVERDEHETGDRRKLNLGHTLAHAIEKCSNRMNHGEAVAVGRDGEDRLCAGRVRDRGSGKDIQPKRMSEVRAKKALGQHFLVDLNIARKICDSLGGGTSEKPCPVLEVGCGMGVLTRFLLKRTDVVTYGAEIDSESVAYLHAHYPEFTPRLMEGDFLKMDLRTLFPEGLRVIGNFPYNISSQIFFKVLENRDLIPECVGMIQKEVAVRLAEPPGSKEYGILSVLLQAWYDIEYLFTVNETVFNPPPKVKSAVVRLRRNGVDRLDCDERLFVRVVKASFGQRRKMLRNSLRAAFGDFGGAEHPFFTQRAERLSVADFVELTRWVDANGIYF